MTISVCMIVKNEEKCLAKCLDSLYEIADEIIIVDTGSTDNTKSIAGRYTDKIYDFTWTGNFSDARNYSFSLAGCDYIYCADADEELDAENIARFKLLKENLLPEIEIVQMYYCNQMANNTIYNFDKELRPKLYKRLRTFNWIEPIHEQVNLNPVVYDSDIEIIHRPESVHAGRDLKAFERMLSSGEPLSDRLLSMYEKELYIAGERENYEVALDFFEKLCDKEGIEGEEFMCAVAICLRAANILDDMPRMVKYAARGAATDGCSEICCELGNFFMKQDMPDEAAMWYYNAAYETHPLIDIRSGNEIPLSYLQPHE